MRKLKHNYWFTMLKYLLLSLLTCTFIIMIFSKPNFDRLDNDSASLIATAYSNTEISNDVQNWKQVNYLEFIENRGQIIDTDGNPRPDIAYVADGNGAKLYFTSTGVSYVFTKIEKSEAKNVSKFDPGFREFERDEFEDSQVTIYRMDMKLLNSNPNVRIYAAEEAEGYFNYYYAHCPDGILRVKAYKRLIYENIYDNIDLVFYDNKQGMEYDFVVKPGGKVQNIRFQYNGAEQVSLIKDGKLKVVTPVGQIIENEPKSFTDENYHSDNIVKSYYRIINNIISFEVADYDTSQALIIDPELLAWATYYGGSSTDRGWGIASDGNGSLVIIGHTYSANFPVISGAFQDSNAGNVDAFIVKLDSSGSRQWATYYGGNSSDWGYDIAIDLDDFVIITGRTSSKDFPVTTDLYQSNVGTSDAFIIKLNRNGERYWAARYGGSGEDVGSGVAADKNGFVVITGWTNSTDFPGADSCAGGKDAFIVQFSGDGWRWWATYYGGSGDDYGADVAIDGNRDIIITGSTESTDFPVINDSLQTSNAGLSDAFIVKFRYDGRVIHWATYYGGSSVDYGNSIATDGNGNVVITGSTDSKDFPVTSDAFKTTNQWCSDAFIVKLNSSGSRQWATCYGGKDYDHSNGIAIDGNGNVVIIGDTHSSDFPMTSNSGSFQSSHVGDRDYADAFIIKFSSSGSRRWATCYGYDNQDCGEGIFTDRNDNIVVTGYTYSTVFPVTDGCFQPDFGGGTYDLGSTDAFIVKFSVIPLPAPTLSSPSNGTIDVSTKPVLYWNPVSGAISYRLQVSVHSDFATTAFDESGITTTSQTVADLSSNTRYYWRVNANGESITTDWSDTWNFTTGPKWILEYNVFFPSYGNPSDYRQTDYRIIGLPGANDVLVNSLFSGTQGKDWQVYRDNGNASTNPEDYLLAYDGSSHFLLGNGRAFWMINKGPLNINTSVDPPSMDNSYAIIQLHEGWNLITNPFLTSVNWSDVKQANTIVTPIWKYEGTNGFDSLTIIFEPYIGYYFDAPSDLNSLKIPSPYVLQKKSVLAEEDPAMWRVRMILSCGEFRDKTTSFGIVQNSSREFDRLDFCKPRSVATSPIVSFYRPQWDHSYSTFATDIRPEFDEIESWDFEVRGVHQQSSCLDFKGIEQIPEPMEIYLVDEGRGKYINLREQSSYNFRGIGDIMKFQVIVGKSEAVKDKLSEINMPKQFSLGNNYPNPFNPATTIPIEIPVASDVTLKIYNILGQEVKIVYEGHIEIGQYQFTWNGRDQAGNRLASGVYILQLSTNTRITLTSKMILMQ